jgi:hypothetical protein
MAVRRRFNCSPEQVSPYCMTAAIVSGPVLVPSNVLASCSGPVSPIELLSGAPARGTARWKSRRCQCGACRVHAASPVHAAARMCRGRGQVEAADRRTRPAHAGNGSEDQLLVERRSSPIDDPPIKLASRRSMSRAVRMRRATIRCEKSGASCSIRSCTRSANCIASSASHDPVRFPPRRRAPAAVPPAAAFHGSSASDLRSPRPVVT